MNFFDKETQLINDYLDTYFSQKVGSSSLTGQFKDPSALRLIESMRYSLFTGGKRFRPALALLTGEMLGVSNDRILPYACAVEMIHTYSLIHDDLPSMDDDNVRRGQPTNHMAFDEATALLAGDALLTEAFSIIAEKYANDGESGLKLVGELSRAAGAFGMIGGQVMDLAFERQQLKEQQREPLKDKGVSNIEALKEMQAQKTGELIRVSVTGAAILARVSEKKFQELSEFGALLGLSFQLADDLQDFNPKDPEASGYPRWIGVKETKALMKKTSEGAFKKLLPFGEKARRLSQIIEYNLNREI